MIRLTEQQALSVHEMMIKATGGSGGVRDIGFAPICSERPLSSVFRTLQVKIFFGTMSHP